MEVSSTGESRLLSLLLCLKTVDLSLWPPTHRHSYDTGTIGGILASPYWLEHFGTTTDPVSHKKVLTTNQESEIVSLLSVGTFFGSLFAAPTGDLLGRRLGLVAAAFVFTIGVILQVCVPTRYASFVS